MTRPAGNLLIQPLFYDLLSGEFRPPSDPAGKTHQLGRLAYKTYMVGVQSYNRDVDKNYFKYNCNWVDGVNTEITAGYLFYPQVHIMSEFAIETAAGSKLTIGFFDANGTAFALVNHTDARPLELGKPLNELREEVTQLAQDLFDGEV